MTGPLERWEYGYAYLVVAEIRNGLLHGFLGRYGVGDDVRINVVILDILNELGAERLAVTTAATRCARVWFDQRGAGVLDPNA